MIKKLAELNEIALKRNQTLAQMAIAWLLKDNRVTSILIGASKVSQLEDCIKSLENKEFSENELSEIKSIIDQIKL